MSVSLKQAFINLQQTIPLATGMVARGNVKQLMTFLGPAFNGLIMQNARGANRTLWQADHVIAFDWTYARDNNVMKRLFDAANSAQWSPNDDIDWSFDFDPLDTRKPLIPDQFCPGVVLPAWGRMAETEKAEHRRALLSWMLSQVLHGEQGALFGAAQVVQTVPWMDGKLLGSSQIADEGKHIETFHRYLNEKLCRVYHVNDNLYTLVEALMSDSRWDVKFLGMQIMIEGFGLGAFSLIKKIVTEPTLQQILRFIMLDESRHVNYGVLALEQYYRTELNERELREREDLAYEITLMMQRRFLIHEMYEEYWTHQFSLQEWNKFAASSQLMQMFRRSMFRIIMPNLKRIGLLSDRIKPKYDALGVLEFQDAPYIYEMKEDAIMAL